MRAAPFNPDAACYSRSKVLCAGALLTHAGFLQSAVC